MKRWNIQYILLIFKATGVFARRYGLPIHLPVGYITINHQPTSGYITVAVNRQPVGILPSTIKIPVGILPINKHLISGLCWSTGSKGAGTNFLKVAKHQDGVLENLPQQRLCCMNLASGSSSKPPAVPQAPGWSVGLLPGDA